MFKVLSRHENKGDNESRCPECKETFSDFMVIVEKWGLLGCYKCGTVFVSKERRVKEKQERVENAAKIRQDILDRTCELCGKVAKSKHGLSVHMKKHEAEIEMVNA